VITLPPDALEWAANLTTAASVLLAARRHLLTWPIGIVGCVLFALLFLQGRLYADASLQLFFIVTSLMGWRQWQRQQAARHPSMQPALGARQWSALLMIGAVVTLAYGALLWHFTDAFAPYWDSAVMVGSVIGQILLMRGQRETWPLWIAVNTLSVPLYLSRGLNLTALLYVAFWFNAWYGWWRWRPSHATAPGSAPTEACA